MDLLNTNHMLLLERSMDFLWTKQTAILDNIANVETPNYKAKYVTFEDTLRKRLEAVNPHASNDRSVEQYRSVLNNTASTIHETTEESLRMDGNNVNATEQNVELSRTAYQLQFVYQAVSAGINILRAAITG